MDVIWLQVVMMEEFMCGESSESALAGFVGIARRLTVGRGNREEKAHRDRINSQLSMNRFLV